MRHPLDRPIWAALTSRQSALAVGSGRALRYDQDYIPFAAAEDDSPDALAALGGLVPQDGSVVLLQAGHSPVPPGIVVEKEAAGVQMVLDRLAPTPGEVAVEPLSDADAAAMQELAKLTEPGPFANRTHELGTFHGVKREGRLVAMAGERMKLDGFTEVSGVATHPDFRGRGYAAFLTWLAARRIAARGETPFLHAYAGNSAAIRLYEALGFRTRVEMTVTVLQTRASIDAS